MNTLQNRAAAYLARLPHAVSGAGGHSATFTAACRLVEFGLSFEQAMPLLAAWNQTHCQPYWTEIELRHKLADAFKRTSVKSEFVTGRRNVTDRGALASGVTHLRAVTPAASQPSDGFSALVLAIDRLMRPSELTIATRNAIALSRQRGLDNMALMAAWFRGFLRFDNYFGKPAWFILDKTKRNACARRLDGKPWNEGTRNECKVMILPSAQAKWPIGISEAKAYPNILLCEGAPDFLAAFHFINTMKVSEKYAPVAMLSGSYPIHTDALRMFKGKRVRIYAHNDSTGRQAAAKWTQQIQHHATAIDVFPFAQYGVKDLNDFARGNFLTTNLLP